MENPIAGPFGINIHTKLTNRRVVAQESVTAPAGTYSGYRIEYHTDATVAIYRQGGSHGHPAPSDREGLQPGVYSYWVVDRYSMGEADDGYPGRGAYP